MFWKPKKQKELTKDEAIALAKQELAPHWHKVSPLLAGVRTEAGVSAVPLEPLFGDNSWLLIFVDPTDFNGEAAVHFAKEFHRRYSPYCLRGLLILKAPYAYLRERDAIEQHIERRGILFPVALDHDGLLSAAFRATEGTRCLILSAKGIPFEASGPAWARDAELGLQVFLRSTDPGLPLLPVLERPDSLPSDLVRLDFGKDRGVKFPAPGFTTPLGAFSAGEFPVGGSANMNEGVPLALAGRWVQDGDRIATTDPKAQISMHAPGPGMGFVAEPLKKSVDGGRVVVEVNGIATPDIFADENLSYDDEGHSLVRADGPRLYRVLKKLSERERNITLRFPYADQVPVALYGVRFWTTPKS